MDPPPAGTIRREPVPEAGLTVVFEPDQPSLDVVFVHGFTGHPAKTWTHKQSSSIHDGDDGPPSKLRKLHSSFRSSSHAAASAPVFWPRDLLPSTIPDARVLTYGYDTHLRHKILGPPVNQLTIYDFAKDLLVAIEANRRDDSSRPILFVCHSLGGIVVKEMLRQACQCQDAELRLVFPATVGIMFFGTPHSGADPRELLHHVIEKLVRIAGWSANEQIVNALLPTSERLRQLKDEFNPIAQQQDWIIHSFQEAQGVRTLFNNRVVDDLSSYLGLGSIERTEHINSDHMDMCRFSGVNDPEYLKVAAALRRMTASTHRIDSDTPSALTDAQSDALLQSLRFSQIDSRLLSVKAAHAKTCSWFLQSPTYLDWLDTRKLDNHHGFLWIKAKPGAGKSTLMKFVLTKYRRKFRDSVSFFFNARGVELERTTIGMYRSLLVQLLESQPSLRKAFQAAEIAPWSATSDHTWTLESLKLVFEEAVHLLGPSDSVTCFIDALDECPESEIRDMLDLFQDLGQHAVAHRLTFRVLLSSRHYPLITISRGLDMVLEAQDDHFEDIRKYVEGRLRIQSKKPEFRDEVLGRIQEKASGVFMWVVLVVDILNKCHDEGRPAAYIRKKLEALPSDLGELFRDILMRDTNDRDELLLCLQWVLFARRPLSPEELFCALHTGVGTQALETGDLEEEQVERFLLNSSKGLVEIIKTKAKAKSKPEGDLEGDTTTKTETRTVQFIHESVRDFLLKEDGLSTLWPHLGTGFEAQSHDKLRSCCFSYITTYEAGLSGLDICVTMYQQSLPFLEYATQGVLFHANAAAVGHVAQDEFLRDFPLRRWVNLHNTVPEKPRARQYTEGVTLLYVLAEHNLAALIPVQSAISGETGLETGRGRFGPPLLAALATRSKDAAVAISQAIIQAEPPLPGLQESCAMFRQSEISKRWSRHFRYGRTLGLLWNALGQGDDLLTNFLLNLSPETRSSIMHFDKERMGQTPLAYATRYGFESVLKTLLQTGADIEGRNEKTGATPLITAAESGNESAVQLLLEAGADVEARTDLGMTALHLAASEGRSTVIKVLLEAGADVEWSAFHGSTALHFAAAKGHLAVVRKLLDANADTEARDHVSRTPLFLAATGDREDVARLLIERGANIEAKDSAGRTPLGWAAEANQGSTITALVKAGANIEVRDSTGRTPLFWAFRPDNPIALECLLRNGARTETRDNAGRTPLSWAVSLGNSHMVDVLLQWGAQVESKDEMGRTPVSWAAACRELGGLRCMELLLGKGAQIETEDNNGRTPLSVAAEAGFADTVEFLLQNGAKIETKDNDGLSPMDRAVVGCDAHQLGEHGIEARGIEVIKVLLQNGARVETGDRSALEWAYALNFPAIINLLEEHCQGTVM